MKKIAVIIVSLSIVLTLGFLEQMWIDDTFSELSSKTRTLLDSCQAETITTDDMRQINDWWLKKKETVHIYLRHDTIATLDNFMAEAQGHIAKNNFDLAYAQLYILLDSAETIPLSFKFHIQNIL